MMKHLEWQLSGESQKKLNLDIINFKNVSVKIERTFKKSPDS